jgi:cytochrome c5
MSKRTLHGVRVFIFAFIALAMIGGCSDSNQGEAGESDSEQASVEPGKKTYTRYCFSCHAAGVAGAPRTGDAVAWAPRIEKGTEKMLESVIQGMPPGMPARGMCLQCSDEELADALDFMLQRSQ